MTTPLVQSEHMPFVPDDGGRAAASFKGHAGDCVARAIAIASRRPYKEVYDALAAGNAGERQSKRRRGPRGRTARSGIHVKRTWFKAYMQTLGFEWVPTMRIGSGCTVHLVAGELPMGRLVVAVSGHYTAVIDGVVRDTHDPQRRTFWYKQVESVAAQAGQPQEVERITERCVYGYYVFLDATKPTLPASPFAEASSAYLAAGLRKEAVRYEAAAKQQDHMQQWSGLDMGTLSRERAALFRAAADRLDPPQKPETRSLRCAKDGIQEFVWTRGDWRCPRCGSPDESWGVE